MASNALANALSNKNLGIVWAYEKARLRRSCFGVDRQTGREFESHLSYEWYRLRKRVRGHFAPSGLLAIAKPKPAGGDRIICVPTIADRFLQFAILAEIRPALERRGLLNAVSYGLIRSAKRGVRDARDRALELRTQYPWVYKSDIQKFFDRVPRPAIKYIARKIISQRSLHPIIFGFVDSEVQDGFDPHWKDIVAKAGIVEGRGVRQGMPLSPYLAGMVLRKFDREVERRGIPAIRYVDDIVGFFRSREECDDFHRLVVDLLGELELSVGEFGASKSKTVIYEPGESADFLGMEIAPDGHGSYCLRVSEDCIERVSTRFAATGSIEELLKKGITLTRLGTHLDAMESGYLQAYEGARNHNDLVGMVRRVKEAAMQTVLEELFGEQICRLTKRHRRFIGIWETS